MNVGSIAGGTHAGWRRVNQAHKTWPCRCTSLGIKSENPGWRGECDDCGDKRPT